MSVYVVRGQGREEAVSVTDEVAVEVAQSVAHDEYVPERVGYEWVEEFGGGAWVPTAVLSTPRSVMHSILYGPGYQGPQGTRSTTGAWTEYPGL